MQNVVMEGWELSLLTDLFLILFQSSNSIKPLVLIQGIFWTMSLNLRSYINYKNEVAVFVSLIPLVKENETFAYCSFQIYA